MISKGQASVEFLIVLVIVIALIVLIFFELPKNLVEITALGITKNHLDNFILKSNYLGDYNLSSNVENKDINILVNFSHKTFDSNSLETVYIPRIIGEIKESSDFNNVHIIAK